MNPSDFLPNLEDTVTTGKPKPPSNLRDFISTVTVLLVAVLVAVGLITFVFQSYEVDGESMDNTLRDNDRLIVWKMPRTVARITGNQYVPNRGDIIVFVQHGLAACGQTGERQLVKRVIGLPGDRVVVINNTVTIYSEAYPDGYKPDVELPYGKEGAILEMDNNIDVTLNSKQIFVMGDNRPGSCDSRSFGPVQLDDVVGKLAIRVLPFNKIERF